MEERQEAVIEEEELGIDEELAAGPTTSDDLSDEEEREVRPSTDKNPEQETTGLSMRARGIPGQALVTALRPARSVEKSRGIDLDTIPVGWL